MRCTPTYFIVDSWASFEELVFVAVTTTKVPYSSSELVEARVCETHHPALASARIFPFATELFFRMNAPLI